MRIFFTIVFIIYINQSLDACEKLCPLHEEERNMIFYRTKMIDNQIDIMMAKILLYYIFDYISDDEILEMQMLYNNVKYNLGTGI
jgi:hypothetical protein